MTETISYNQALVTLLFAKDDVDESNAHIHLLRMQKRVINYLGGTVDLDAQRTYDEVDDTIIMLSTRRPL